MMYAHVLIDDEERNQTMHVRIGFEHDAPDAGDSVTPPYESGVDIQMVKVQSVAQLDEFGEIEHVLTSYQLSPENNDRARKVMEECPLLMEVLHKCAREGKSPVKMIAAY